MSSQVYGGAKSIPGTPPHRMTMVIIRHGTHLFDGQVSSRERGQGFNRIEANPR